MSTHTLAVPGVDLVYDVHGEIASDTVPLFLIGSPMSAGGFPSLASRLSDRTLITYDPRGCERSQRTDEQPESTPADHAGDLHAIIEALEVSAVDMFASSGGATNSLALVAAHPADVRVLVAHESPAVAVLPDREAAAAVVADMADTYRRLGFNHAMAKFIVIGMHEGEFTEPFADVDPAQFGMPTEDDGKRDDPLFFQNARGGYSFVPDYDALRAAPTRIVLAAGEETGNTVTARPVFAMAPELGVEVTMFPGGHAGFLGGEYGQHGEPDAFAARLREVLAG